MSKALEYIEGVLCGEIISGRYARLAVERHVKDLKDPKILKDFYFDEAHAEKIIKIFPLFKLIKGKWKKEPFKLEPWQAFMVHVAYGWKKKANNKRRFNKIYIKVARKNGKTEFLAAVSNIGLIFDKENGPEIYWAATKREQARIGWERQKSMLKKLIFDSKYIKKLYDTNQRRIFAKNDDAFSVALGKDSKTEDGLNPHYALVDEYHAHPNAELLDVLESGMGAREQPMTWIITTAGFNVDGPCYNFEQACKSILDGRVTNNEIFPMIFDLDEGDDWEDEKTWYKPNPSLNVTVSLDFLRSEYNKAKTEGLTKEISFKTKNLNIWVRSSTGFITDKDWMQYATQFTENDLIDRPCFGGLDLSSKRDLTSLCLFFPAIEEGEKHRALWWYWCPERQVKSRVDRDKVFSYPAWVKDGWLTATPGNVIDYDYIRRVISGYTQQAGTVKYVEDCLMKSFQIQAINYDRWNSPQIIPKLTEEGVNMEPFGQGYASMSSPTKELEKLILAGELDPGLNPVSRWQMGNIEIEMDASENVKITKKKSRDKVDGMVALVMAIGGWMAIREEEDKPYLDNGIFYL